MVRGLPYRACGEQLGLIVGDQIKREVREISLCIGAIRRRSRRGSRRRRKRRRRPERERERDQPLRQHEIRPTNHGEFETKKKKMSLRMETGTTVLTFGHIRFGYRALVAQWCWSDFVSSHLHKSLTQQSREY